MYKISTEDFNMVFMSVKWTDVQQNDDIMSGRLVWMLIVAILSPHEFTSSYHFTNGIVWLTYMDSITFPRTHHIKVLHLWMFWACALHCTFFTKPQIYRVSSESKARNKQLFFLLCFSTVLILIISEPK